MMKTAVLLCGLVCLFGLKAKADIVENGGFETGDFSDWTTTGDLKYTGVTSATCPGPGSLPNKCTPYDGNYAAFFDTNTDATGISQSLATVAGDTYTLSYWLNVDASGSGTEGASYTFSWNGVAFYSSTNVTDVSGFNEYIQTSLLATSTSTTLQFTINDPLDWMGLDDISVTDNNSGPADTPEPVTIALSGLGLLLAGVARKRLSAARG